MTQPSRAKYKHCKRYDVPGHAHELTSTCFRGLRLLSRNRTREWLVEAIGRARSRHSFDVWAYVIMPEHVHLLIFPRHPDYSVSRIIRSERNTLSVARGKRKTIALEISVVYLLQRLLCKSESFITPICRYSKSNVEMATYPREKSLPLRVHSMVSD